MIAFYTSHRWFGKARSSCIEMRSQDSGTAQTNVNNSSSFVTGSSNTTEQSQQQNSHNSSNCSTHSANWTKIQALKQRKCELEKLLAEKNLLLQQIQKQEAQLIGEHNTLELGCNLPEAGNNTISRRKIGRSYKLPKNVLNCKDDGGDVEKLLLEKKIQQEICNASYKLANDPNISKSIRRTHKAEYDAAQQKLIAIHHNLNILKKRQLTQTKSNSLPNPSTTLSTSSGSTTASSVNSAASITSVGVTKSPSIQHSSPDINSKQCNSITADNFNNNNNNTNKHNNNNTVNSYYVTERRNSMKSGILSSPKHLDENSTILVDRSLKNHRSNYDTTRLIPVVSSENSRNSSGNTISSAYNNYLYTNYAIQQQQHQIDDIENYNNSPSQQDSDGNHFGYTNYNCIKYLDSKLLNEKYSNYSQNNQQYDDGGGGGGGGGFAKLPSPSGQVRQSYNLSSVQGALTTDKQQNIVGVLSEKNFYNNNRKYDTVDAVSISPSTVTSFNDQHIGLGGYWRTLPSNERIWCAVENCYDGTQLQQVKVKKINTSMPIKASSLGNFDVITTKDESVDQISISSMNSETSKRIKEKQWLETSLDGPLIRTKSASNSNEMGSRSLSQVGYNHTTIISHQHNLSPTFNTYNLHTTAHPHHHLYKYKYGNRSKLSSQSMSNNSYRPNVTKLEDQIYLSQSTSVLNNNSNNVNPNENQLNQYSLIAIVPPADMHPYSSSQVPPSINDHYNHNSTQSAGQLSPKYNTLKATTRSQIIGNVNKASDIRIESPKNMTVIQPATFMPYKEVTKPFEMSDFYKYSTKFRQKDTKQQQQCLATPIPSVVADAN